ncbi:MAG TPA: hypothetical protein VG738_14020 [Chitinophagaceae bacterium]|nr:hypothetical protein [Chitinophagaceae bacterium]
MTFYEACTEANKPENLKLISRPLKDIRGNSLEAYGLYVTNTVVCPENEISKYFGLNDRVQYTENQIVEHRDVDNKSYEVYLLAYNPLGEITKAWLTIASYKKLARSNATLNSPPKRVMCRPFVILLTLQKSLKGLINCSTFFIASPVLLIFSSRFWFGLLMRRKGDVQPQRPQRQEADKAHRGNL